MSIKTENYYPLSITEILDSASIDLAKRGSIQIPAITYNTGNLQIPFAFGFSQVSAQKTNSIQKLQKSQIAKSNSFNEGWTLLGIGLLLFAVASSDR